MMNKNKRGGKRPGAGRKSVLQDPVMPQAYLDRASYEVMVDLGAGNFSLGIRRASRFIAETRKYNRGDNAIANHLEHCFDVAIKEVK